MTMLLVFLTALLRVTVAKEPIDIYWNISNTVFNDARVPLVEVNRDTLPWEYDQVNIICPSGENVTERHIIYSVNKEEFEECQIMSQKPRIIAVCDQPQNFMYFTITFRSFSPSPQQMEFMPGESYYFISTASERNIHHRVGGHCLSDNMRMIFRVAENEVESSPTSLNHPRPTVFWSKYWNSRVPDIRDIYRTRDPENVFSDNEDNSVRNSDEVYPKSLGDNRNIVMGYDESLERANALRLHSSSSPNTRWSQSTPVMLVTLLTIMLFSTFCS